MNANAIFSRMNACGISISEAAASRIARYHDMLLDYNTRMDLTAVTDPDEMPDRHYVDSLSVLKMPDALPLGARLIDVGSGAGFPGLPLAIAREDLSVVLLDSLKKRVGFLADVISELKLSNVQAVHLRAEDGAHNPLYREQFDVGIARAVAALPVLLEYVLPFVKQGGQALLWKGPGVKAELADGERVAALLGGEVLAPVSMPIQGRDWQHFIIPVRKSFPTPRQYPRKSGTPLKQPLHQNL